MKTKLKDVTLAGWLRIIIYIGILIFFLGFQSTR